MARSKEATRKEKHEKEHGVGMVKVSGLQTPDSHKRGFLTMINTPEIIFGEYDDPFKDVNPIRGDGSVNWGAAMMADPGVKKCEECGTFYWNLARVMRCTKEGCGATFGEGV